MRTTPCEPLVIAVDRVDSEILQIVTWTHKLSKSEPSVRRRHPSVVPFARRRPRKEPRQPHDESSPQSTRPRVPTFVADHLGQPARTAPAAPSAACTPSEGTRSQVKASWPGCPLGNARHCSRACEDPYENVAQARACAAP